MFIDCDRCVVRGRECGDCVVTVLLGSAGPAVRTDLDGAEREAIAVLAGSGLVPPLRLAPGGGEGPGSLPGEGSGVDRDLPGTRSGRWPARPSVGPRRHAG